ncbi:MAG TPA: hypothetical protein VGE22_16750, partial [Solimonas sp.]
MKIERHTVQYRLMKWGQWCQEPAPVLSRCSSPFGRIAEMKENAGIRGDGIVFDLIEVDGEVVSCPPDGGMSAMVERQGRAQAHDIRCREVNEAVLRLPQGMRRIIEQTYQVPHREHPRSARVVAELLKITQQTVQEALKIAHKRISASIY